MKRGILTATAIVVCLWALGVSAAFWNKKRNEEDRAGTTPPALAPTSPAEEVPATLAAGAPVVSPPSFRDDRPAAAAPPALYRRPHVSIQDSETERILVQLAQTRSLREEEIKVLTRLSEEKTNELGRMNERLQQRFGIRPEENYQFDQASRTLFKLTVKEGIDAETAVAQGAAADEVFDKTSHMTLRDEAAETDFVRLVSAKKITASELQVLGLLLKEKRIELSKVHASLEERFAISPEKHYEYDAEAHTLFETVPAAGGAATGGNPGR